MAFTTPRTWVTDEIVTSSLLNTHVRDNLLAIAHPYDYAPADVAVANTVTETSLWSKVITGNDLGVNGSVNLEVAGDALRNNGAGDTLTVRVKFGGSTVIGFADAFNGLSVSANRYPWRWQVRLENRGATNAQFVMGTFFHWNWNQLPSNATVGIGGTATNGDRLGMVQNTVAVDTTADQTLQVTVQWSAASANNSWRKRSAVLTLGQN